MKKGSKFKVENLKEISPFCKPTATKETTAKERPQQQLREQGVVSQPNLQSAVAKVDSIDPLRLFKIPRKQEVRRVEDRDCPSLGRTQMHHFAR